MNRCYTFLLYILPGIVIISLALIFGFIVLPKFIRSKIEENVRLVEGSDTWNKWKQPPIPIYLSFYIHHIINPDEVESGIKAKFQEKGPYVYQQKRLKVDIRQDDGPNTVKYRDVVRYFFDQKLSGNNTENDLVNVPNIPFIGVLYTVRKILPIELLQGIVGNLVLNNEPLIRRNVAIGELLFKGFDVSKYTHSLLGSQLPAEFSGGRFGLYKGKNGTASEVWEIYTGVDDSLKFGQVKSWNGSSTLGYWQPFSECDRISGTDGSIFQPFLTRQIVLHAFAPDVCRSLPMAYRKDVEHRGISGYRFSSIASTFEDPRINWENQCFCLEKKLDDCSHTGLLPLFSCKKAPVWVSTPYFLDADIRYLSESGLANPNREIHETYIDLEPNSGLILHVHKRIQIGIEVQHSRKVRALQNLRNKKVLFPLIWADESAEMDEALANEIKSKLLTPLRIVDLVKWGTLIVGIVAFFLGIILFFMKSNQPIADNSHGRVISGFGGLRERQHRLERRRASKSPPQSQTSISTIS